MWKAAQFKSRAANKKVNEARTAKETTVTIVEYFKAKLRSLRRQTEPDVFATTEKALAAATTKLITAKHNLTSARKYLEPLAKTTTELHRISKLSHIASDMVLFSKELNMACEASGVSLETVQLSHGDKIQTGPHVVFAFRCFQVSSLNLSSSTCFSPCCLHWSKYFCIAE